MCKGKFSLYTMVIVTSLVGVVSAPAQRNGQGHRLTIEELVEIKHPSNPMWSPDGRQVAFAWDHAGISNLYVVRMGDQGQPIALTSFPEGQVEDAFWSHDSHTLYFPYQGELWQVPDKGGTAKPTWSRSAPEVDFAPSPDGTRIAFVRRSSSAIETSPQGADLVIRSLTDGTEAVVVHDDLSLARPVWSPDGSSLAYTAGFRITNHDDSPSYSGAKIIYRAEEYVPGQVYAVRMGGGKPIPIGAPGEYGGLAWVDTNHLVYDRQSNDYKRYAIFVADIADGKSRAIHEVAEKEFWSIPDWEAGAQPWPSPDGRWIAFLSDRDGWDHLYVVPAAGGEAVQITKGRFEVWRPAWSHDSMSIAFDANEPGHLGDRRIGITRIGNDPTHATVTYLTRGLGTNIEPHWSPDDKRVLYQHTDSHSSADLYAIEVSGGGKPVRLTDSMPSSIDRSRFVEPQFVTYPGADGQPVPGWLFVPKNLDGTKHPAIIWVHGDGVNQNYDGWHVERNYAVYYSFHQYLLQEGYVVFAPDYRGSIGYGRDWRTGVYMDAGGKDAKDAWMAATYLKTLSYVDAERIGIWGLSYGGFFTLIAMTNQPRMFRAGVDVAGVVDYSMYYTDPYHGDWTVSRIGTPEQNPQIYRQASPISHIDRLERPLLVLHGTADVNVPFLESVWLIDEALKKGKGNLLSFMMYPGEFHYFRRGRVLRDAWHRVDDFFATHLRSQEQPNR